MYGASLMFSKAFEFFSLVRFDKTYPVEKASDVDARQLLLRCAATFAMDEEHVKEFFDSPTEQISAFGIGLARNLQQSMKYALYYVTMTFLSEKVFTLRDVYASDTIKVHLGLIGPNAGKCIMGM